MNFNYVPIFRHPVLTPVKPLPGACPYGLLCSESGRFLLNNELDLEAFYAGLPEDLIKTCF